MPTELTASELLLPDRVLPSACVSVNPEGRIAAIQPLREQPSQTSTLTPAFLDIHIHGAVGHDVMSATPTEFSALQRFLATRGVAHYLPTTVTASIDATLHALERMADAIERGPQPHQAQPIGIHLEGPFLSHVKRGVHPAEHLQPPSIALFDRLQQAARGHVLLMTLAPEAPGALDLIAHAAERGVRVSLGHTNATAAQTLAAIQAGATSATHIFNAMRALDHREPGVLGTVLDDEHVFAELICDGIHVAPALVRLWLRAKGPDRAILITDAMSATGSGDGAYALGGLPVTVENGRALLTEELQHGRETLAGSVLTLEEAAANLQRFTGASLATAVAMASHTPAAMLGKPELTTIATGSPANLNRFDAQGRLIATYLRGEEVPLHGEKVPLRGEEVPR